MEGIVEDGGAGWTCWRCIGEWYLTHSVSTTSEGCPYSRKVSPRRLMVVLSIGVFRIGDSDSEITTSSVHTADDCPSSYIGLPISELSSNTPPTAEMNSEDRLQAMEEELMKH